MHQPPAWTLARPDAVSSAPFADNLPAPADAPLLTGPETLWASIAILVVTVVALLA